MKRKKTFVIMVSERFPRYHPRAGEPTGFIVQDEDGQDKLNPDKLHTIRENAKLWEKRAKKINAGEARLSVRKWTGKPYRSKQKEILSLDKIGTEVINVKSDRKEDLLILGKYFASGDGLSEADFNSWFDFKLDEVYVIIHFTDFRYTNAHKNN
jgi:hypothetical protein